MKRLLRGFALMHIDRKLTVSMIVLVILPIMVINSMYFRDSESFLRGRILESEQQVLHIAATNVEKFTEQVISATNVVCFNSQLSMRLMKKKHGTRLAYADLVQVYNTLYSAQMSLLDYTAYLNLYDAYGECISTLSTTNEFSLDMTAQLGTLRRVIDASGRFVWFAPLEVRNQTTNTTEAYFVIGRLVNGTSEKADNASVMLLFMDVPQLANKLLRLFGLPQSDALFIVDGDGNIILHGDAGRIGASMDADNFVKITGGAEPYLIYRDGDRNIMLNHQKIKNTDWWLVKQTDYSAQMNELATIRLDNILFILIILVLFVFITFYLCRSTMRPLKRLKDQVESVREGHFRVDPVYSGGNEIAQLGNSFNQMIVYINDLIEQMRLEQESKEQLRLELMQAQINPHFIFNTLNTIKWTALIHNDQDIAALVQDFGRIVGMSIRDMNRLISIRSELSNLDSYLNIHRMRFNYPVSLRVHCAQQDTRLMVPCLVMQPIVENTLTHGFDTSYEKELNVCVHIERQGEDLLLLVSDDGVGIGGDKLRAILEDLTAQHHKNRYSRIGLQNVHKRIQMMFGARYGISIQSERGKGTRVEIRLPQTPGQDQEDEDDQSPYCG